MATDIDAPEKTLYKPLLPENWVGSSLQQRLLLAVLFSLSFIFPVLFGLKFVTSWVLLDPPQVEELDPVFPENIAVQWQGAFLKISDNPVLTPQGAQDYLMISWFNLKRVPQPGEDMTLLSKVDHGHPLRPGLALSLVRHGSSVRPALYWKDSQGKGGWYHFADIRIVPRTWFGLVLSVHASTTIGLHLITIEEGKPPQRELLGGYKLSLPVIPRTSAPMYIGSMQTGSFRGKIGPVGIFSGSDLSSDFKEIFKEISRDPLSIPSSISKSEVMLWSPDGKKDRSSFNHPIVRSKVAERGTKTKSDS